MQFTFKAKENIYNVMRRCGYAFEKQEGVELAFSRPAGVSRSGYPRFHIYLRMNSVPHETTINLHLDQKKPVYMGVTAHSGEYDGELVEQEIERLKKILGL